MKLGVCVPYRDRELHLNEFIPKVSKYLKDRNIDFHMYFAHQCDDKLFNRGATKNIAAKHAFEDGCDYIVWHDIDMIPEEGADYSYPTNNPRHIATQISQMNYELKYHEYFGGAVLFTKEQAEKTNGYSNEYWDWGMEDDDLFWRCHKEGYLVDEYYTEREQVVYKFNGTDSKIKWNKRDLRNLTSKSHTISCLVKAEHQLESNKIFLIGDKENRYHEYPIFRIPGFDYGFSFNNSRALTLQYWNNFDQHQYMWVKRYDQQWSWITAVIDSNSRISSLYLNGTEVDTKGGYGSPSPFNYTGKLKRYGNKDWYLGHSPSDNSFFKGDIGGFWAWDRALEPHEVKYLYKGIPSDVLFDLSTEKDLQFTNVEKQTNSIRVPESIKPHRIEGKFRCLPHKDEGLVDGKWAKGETTAKNEERYVLGMQQDKIDYKNEGLNTLKYKLLSTESLTPFATMINVEL